MDDSEYTNIFHSEGEHFYYKSVHHLILGLVDKFSPSRENLEILDAGCGTGGLAVQLATRGKVSAVDLHPKAVEYAGSRGVNVVQSSIKEMPFPTGHFDVVTCVDVIYHQNVDDDVAALKEIRRVLKPDGVLVMRVPARPELFSSHDLLVWTKRRYTRRHLRKSLHLAGLKPKRLSYCHGSLYLPALIKAKLDKATASKEHSAVEATSGLVNRVAERVLKLESQMVMNGIDLPLGLGIVAVAGLK
jgi:2-polyprenyl-3-methyl-5-hydroxy-6-metoxy-1,4-benzoquinol methylase